MRRRLDTGSEHDVKLVPGQAYAFGCAAFDRCSKRHAYNLRSRLTLCQWNDDGLASNGKPCCSQRPRRPWSVERLTDRLRSASKSFSVTVPAAATRRPGRLRVD